MLGWLSRIRNVEPRRGDGSAAPQLKLPDPYGAIVISPVAPKNLML